MAIEKITEILRMCELFSELSDNELESIAKLGRIEKFKPGEKIYEQGNIGAIINNARNRLTGDAGFLSNFMDRNSLLLSHGA